MRRTWCWVALAAAACSPTPPGKEIVYVPPPPADPAAPIIDEIRVEKDTVCRGEEDLVTVKAHTPDGTDALLHYVIGLESGRQVPVRFRDPYTNGEGWPTVAVFSPDSATIVPIPAVTVRNCEVPELDVTGSVGLNKLLEFKFEAGLRNASGFVPVHLRWDFGDGQTTAGGFTAVHDYWEVPQPTAYTELLVSAFATDGSGKEIRGRFPLELSNDSYLARSAGRILVLAQPIDFGKRGTDGVMRWDYLLWHYDAAPVTLDAAKALLLHTSGRVEEVAVDLTTLATIPAIPPDQRVQVTFQHDFSGDGDVYCINYQLAGQGSGLPAQAQVSLFAQ